MIESEFDSLEDFIDAVTEMVDDYIESLDKDEAEEVLATIEYNMKTRYDALKEG